MGTAGGVKPVIGGGSIPYWFTGGAGIKGTGDGLPTWFISVGGPALISRT